MPTYDVFGNVNHTEKKVPRFDDPNLGRPVTIPPMGPNMTHMQGDQPDEPYPGAFEPPPKGVISEEEKWAGVPPKNKERIFADDINRIKKISKESDEWLKLSVIDKAVKNSPPPLDDVGGLEDTMFDPFDPEVEKLFHKAHKPLPLAAVNILREAEGIVSGARHAQHGPKERNHKNIAVLWEAYMQLKEANGESCRFISAYDVATMMELLKIARRFAGAGRKNADNYIDGAGYAAIAGEIALNGSET